MILIQGIAGIGKTQLAAKLKKNIEGNYTTFWKELKNFDTFDSVVRDIAGFLRENENFELAEYIESGATDHETIMNILLDSLGNKNYVLFFDNYHEVKKEEIHELFSRFKDRRNRSTVVITTRNPQPFVDLQDPVTEEILDGLDLDATKGYLELMGVEVSPEQLFEIGKRMGGHPLALSLFVSLTKKGEVEVGEILNKLPKKGRLERYLYKYISDLLNDDEQRVMEAISVFRAPVPSEACVAVAQGEKVKKALITLEEKLLVKEKEELYYLHDLIREFSYNLIDNPKDYHRRAGEYYTQLEKTPENILETTHHMIKAAGSITDEVVSYLRRTPENPDPLISHTVLDILKENEITSLIVFNLLDEFISASDSTIKKLFINEYGNFFKKVARIDRKKSIDILKHTVDQADYELLILLSSAVARMTLEAPNEDKEAFKEEACGLWKDIIVKGDTRVRIYVSYHIIYDSNLDPQTKAPLLKYLIESSEDSRDLANAKDWLKTHNLMETQEEKSCADYLEHLKNMPIDKKLQYIWEIKDKNSTPADFIIEALNNVYDQDRDQVAQLLKKLIKSYYKYQTVMQRIPRLIVKLAEEEKDIDIKYLEIFLNENEDNVYIKYAGIRALDLIKDKIGPERVHSLLEPLKADNSPVIRQLALIMEEEIESSSGQVDIMSRLKRLDPKRIIKISYGISRLKSELSVTEEDDRYLFFLMSCWCLLKAVEGTDLELILNIFKPFNKYSDENLKEIYRFIGGTAQRNPAMVLRIANYAFSRGVKDLETLSIEEQESLEESEIRIKEELSGIQQKMSALWVICNVGNRAPLKAKKYLESLIKIKDYPAVDADSIIFFLSCLTDIRDALPDDTKLFFEELSTHQNGNVSGFAKLLLNGRRSLIPE